MENRQLKLLSFLFLSFLNQVAVVRGTNQDGNVGNSDSSYFFYEQPGYPTDCNEVRQQCSINNVTGVHLIQPKGFHEPFYVYCEDDNGETWTVFQRRSDGGILFNRSWSDFKKGFGFQMTEFWLGNEKLASLTNQKAYQLRIDMVNSAGSEFSVIYDNFRIADEGSGFNLISLGHYSGTADTFVSECPGNVEYTQNTFIGEDQTCTILPTDCNDIFKSGSITNGIYTILPNNWPGSPFKVYCNMDNGGGWTVFQKRVNGSVNFYRDWNDYKEGFGLLSHEFWLGNDKIANLTNQRSYELRIDLVNSLNNPYFARYSYFLIASEKENYKLTLGSFTGNTVSDALGNGRGYPFSTRDRDNDLIDNNCAQLFLGGYWYTQCHLSNLNGDYSKGSDQGIWWDNLPGNEFNIRSTEMKIRPI